MGTGMLRRYHGSAGGAVAEAAVPTPVADSDETATLRADLEAKQANAVELAAELTTWREAHDLENLTSEDQAELADIEAAQVASTEDVDAAKAALAEGVEADRIAAEAKAAEEAAAVPTRSATKDAWTDYALAHGKTKEELEGLKRDDIATLFLGPKV